MTLCDTNIIIELLKGNKDTFDTLNKINFDNISISSITCMEIYYGSLNNKELKELKKYLSNINTIHLNQTISRKSIDLIIKYANSHNLEIPDALIAATAIIKNIELFTYNIKDFKYIDGLKLFSY